MCLGIPMQITQIDGFYAQCEAQGVTREVCLLLLPEGEVAVGDFVLVHVGYAIQKMSEAEAASTWEIYTEALALGPSNAVAD